jgi:Zn-dependent protease with chaperone function
MLLVYLSILCFHFAKHFHHSIILAFAILPLLYCIGFLYIFFTHTVPHPKGIVADKTLVPQLLDYIAEVRKRINCPIRIDFIVLTTGSTIYVYQPPSLRNFIKPQKPILVVGISMMSLLSKEELGAVIAHEMAHMTQSQTFYKAYLASITNVLASLATAKVGEFSMNSFVSIYSLPTILIGKIFSWLYTRYFNANASEYRDLERRMELDADTMASNEFGSVFLLRGLIKSCLLKKRHDICRQFLIPIILSLGKSADYRSLFFAGDSFFQKFDGYSVSNSDVIDETLFLKAIECESQLIIERVNHLASIKRWNDDICSCQNDLLPSEVKNRINEIITHKYFKDTSHSMDDGEITELFDSLSLGIFSEAQTLYDVEIIVKEIKKEASMVVNTPVFAPTYVAPPCNVEPLPVFTSPTDIIYASDESTCPVCGKEIGEYVKICPFCKEVIAE